jgi:hypothetical protein
LRLVGLSLGLEWRIGRRVLIRRVFEGEAWIFGGFPLVGRSVLGLLYFFRNGLNLRVEIGLAGCVAGRSAGRIRIVFVLK